MSARTADPAPLVITGLLMLVLAAAVGTPADADLWGQLIAGRDITAAGRLPTEDPYSFTADRAWVNHEWLTAVVLFVVYRVGGGVALIALKVTCIALLMGTVGWRVRRAAGDWRAVAVVLLLGFVGTYWRMHTVRAQVFSVLLFACLMVIVTEVDAGRRRALWMVPAIFVLWVNLHGAWIVGFGMLGIWIAASIVDRGATIRWRLQLVTIGALSLVATLINPYGAEIWMFLARTVRLARPDIQDWVPISSEPLLLGIPWGLTLTAALLGLRETGWRAPVSYVAMISALAFASARVSRIDAFFSVATLVLLSPGVVRLLSRLFGPSPADQAAEQRGILIVTLLTAGALLVPLTMFLGRYATCVTIGGDWPPEPEAARFVTVNRLRGRMLTFFDWGHYAIWHFSPDVKVSIDGRRETLYSNEMIFGHWRFYEAQADAQAFLRALNPDYVWIPRKKPIAAELANAGWTPIFSGPVSIIFARTPEAAIQHVTPISDLPRCFPGP